MSYPQGLDEYTEAQLLFELQRRVKLTRAGRCRYCAQPVKAHTCKEALKLERLVKRAVKAL